jgi:glycosyltransferase involved in cell wall biosynthesis
MPDHARVLMVSKPVAPPWNDSSKNLVRDLAFHMQRHRATVMTRAGVDLGSAQVTRALVYGRAATRFAPALADNARVFARLLGDRGHDLWHFFFAPNPRSSAAGKLAARARRMRTVQTVCSAPAATSELETLMFADRIVVLSRSTEQRLSAAGVSPDRLRRIAPAVSPLAPPSDAERQRVRNSFQLSPEKALVVYPGDVEFSGGAECMLRAHARVRSGHDATLVLACRAKTPAARAHELRLRKLASELHVAETTVFIGETPQIHALLGCADVVALPADTLYAKMDLPLVLIEAMMLARAVVTATGTASAELADDAAALAVAPSVDAVADAISGLLADAAARRSLGERARRAALERYHPQMMASAYETVYDELL